MAAMAASARVALEIMLAVDLPTSTTGS